MLLVAVTSIGAGGPSAGASQAPLTNYAAVGSAEGVRYRLVSVGAPLADTLADVGTPVAQSELDGVSGSSAYAAAPYPGDTVLTAPALAAGAAGLPALPDYPVMTSSRHPTEPESNVDQPGVSLKARSDSTTSEATAVTGGSSDATGIGRSLARSTSTMDESTGTLTAAATSSADVIQVEGLLRIGRVQGSAMASLAPNGEVERSSDVVVADVTVGGVSAHITEEGVVVGDKASPLPVVGQEDDDVLEGVLKQAGISARLLRPSESDDGIVSGAVEVMINGEGPFGPTTQTYTFGRAMARVTSRVGGRTAALPAVTARPATTGDGARPPPGPSWSGSGESLPVTDADVPSMPTSAESPDQAPGALGVSPTAATGFPFADTTSFYLTIVLAALTALGVAQLVRIMGVRTAWIS